MPRPGSGSWTASSPSSPTASTGSRAWSTSSPATVRWPLWGPPRGRGAPARRACLAALHLHDELGEYANELRRSQGLNLSVRIGLNSGEVVVGTIGDDLRL